MTAKSIIQVDVDDAAFQKFNAQFQKYQAQLAKAPGIWAQVNKQVAGTKKSFDDMVADVIAVEVRQKLVVAATREAERLTRTAAQYWLGMARSTRDVASNITRATASLLRWTALSGVFSGLLGAGGLFGIERMASGVAAGRRSSQGLGLSYGSQRAFELNYGKAIDPGSFLSSVRDAMTDVTKRYALTLAGVRNIAGKDTGQVAEELLPLLKRIADSAPRGQEMQALQARGLDTIISIDDLLRLRSMSQREVDDMRKRASVDRRELAVSERTQHAWQDFVIQMDRAGQKIDTVFVNGLSPLAGPLAHLSESFSGLVKSGLDKVAREGWLDVIAEKLDKFSSYIGKPEFERNVVTFVDGIGKVGTAVGRVASFLGGLGLTTAANASEVGGGGGGSSKGTGMPSWAPWVAKEASTWGLWGAAKVFPGLNSVPGVPLATSMPAWAAGTWIHGSIQGKSDIRRMVREGKSMDEIGASVRGQYRAGGLFDLLEGWFGKYQPSIKINKAGDIKVDDAQKVESDSVGKALERWGAGSGPAPPSAPSGTFDVPPTGGGAAAKPDNFIDKYGTPIWEKSSSNDGVARIVAAITAGAGRTASVKVMNATGGDAVVIANQAAAAT